MKKILADEDATYFFAEKLAKVLPSRLIIFLQGDLGAGKTTFVRGLLKGLNFQEKVKSPTFTIVESYATAEHLLFHFDLYRLNDPEELDYIGIRDYFLQPAICLIEWPEQGLTFLPSPDMIIAFEVMDEQTRMINLQAVSDQGKALIEQLA